MTNHVEWRRAVFAQDPPQDFERFLARDLDLPR
jgi:hypothetical protein